MTVLARISSNLLDQLTDSRQLEKLVVRQSPAGKNVSTEAEDIVGDPSLGNNW
jgi:hypothetical protein